MYPLDIRLALLSVPVFMPLGFTAAINLSVTMAETVISFYCRYPFHACGPHSSHQLSGMMAETVPQQLAANHLT